MADFGNVGQFDAYTSFGGPYALHPQSAGRVSGAGMRTPHVRHGMGVGGGVQPVTFGAGLALAGSALSRLGPSIVGGVKKRQASFVQPMNPAATGETSQQGPPTALPTSLSQPASRTGSFQAHPLAAQQEAARAFRERMIATR